MRDTCLEWLSCAAYFSVLSQSSSQFYISTSWRPAQSDQLARQCSVWYSSCWQLFSGVLVCLYFSVSWAGGLPSSSSSCSSPQSSLPSVLVTHSLELLCMESGHFLFLWDMPEIQCNRLITKVSTLKVNHILCILYSLLECFSIWQKAVWSKLTLTLKLLRMSCRSIETICNNLRPTLEYWNKYFDFRYWWHNRHNWSWKWNCKLYYWWKTVNTEVPQQLFPDISHHVITADTVPECGPCHGPGPPSSGHRQSGHFNCGNIPSHISLLCIFTIAGAVSGSVNFNCQTFSQGWQRERGSVKRNYCCVVNQKLL